MQERRTEVRMLCADMVEVCWKDQAGRKKTRHGTFGGYLRLRARASRWKRPFRWGRRFGGRSPDHEFTGNVRYCVYREIGYFVGVEFGADSRWSKKAYRPQHLLDLKKLMG